MSPLFSLASDFIERMANPRYGVLENEEYSLKFGQLVQNKEFIDELRREAARITDVDTLTPYGWIWLLGWARSEGIRLNGDLLLSLMEQWKSVTTMALIISVATQNTEQDRISDGKPRMGYWLSLLVKRILIPSERRSGEKRMEEDLPDTSYAQQVLMALIQADTDVTLDAATILLAEPWSGHEELLQYYYNQLTLLDEGTQAAWNRRLRPPEDVRYR